MGDAVCVNCGKCCYYIKDGVLKKCKHLVKLSNGKTLCRVYKTRLGREIDKGVYCTMYERLEYEFEGCPLNTGKKPIVLDKDLVGLRIPIFPSEHRKEV